MHINRFWGVLVGSSFLLALAGCHKSVPLAAAQPINVPVQAAPPVKATPARAQTQTAAVKTPASKPAQTQTRPAKLTPQERATLNERLARLEDALFDYDKATIRPDAMSALKDDVDVIRGILSNYPAQKLMVEGHADERGSAEYNLGLGDRRASSAEDLLGMMGIPRTQLTVISYGKERPVCSEQSETCWQRNRRVHITAAP